MESSTAKGLDPIPCSLFPGTIPPMKRGVVAGVCGAAVLVGLMLAFSAVRQEREFRRLVAAGDAALTRDQTFEAIEDFSGALALRRDSMLAHLKRGDSYRRRGELTAALRDLRRASTLDPTAPRPLELLGDVNSAMGRYEQAASDYRRYLALDDRAPRVLYKLALAHYRQGQVTLALDPARRAVALDDRMVEAHYLLAMCLHDRQRDAEALRSLARAVQLDPAFGPAREELATLNLALGKTRDGVDQLEALAALEPGRPDRLVNLALAHAGLGSVDVAIATLGRAAERYPDSELVGIARGRMWLDLADPGGDEIAIRNALDAVRPFATRANASSEALTLYGRILMRSDDVEGSERALERATAALPAEPDAFLQLSVAAERGGHVEVARNALARFITLDGDGAHRRGLAAHAADLSLKMNDPAGAVSWGRSALEPDGPDPAVLATIADAQIRLGQIDAARATIAEGLAHDPAHRALLDLRRKIGV